LSIDWGAALVLGSHPHWVQATEWYKGKPILYSLGNFVFGGNVNPADKTAIIYQETFTVVDGRPTPTASTVIPVRVSSTTERNDFRPVILEGDERDKVLALVKKLGDDLAKRPFKPRSRKR
jgi:poly-gamma-glutamate synthesis protein (capsule biosynthesis protein)